MNFDLFLDMKCTLAMGNLLSLSLETYSSSLKPQPPIRAPFTTWNQVLPWKS